MWPKKNLTGFRRYHVLLNAITVFFLLTLPRLAALYLFWGEIDAMIQCFSTHMPFAIGIVKLVILYLQQQALGEFMEKMECDWKNPISNEQYRTMMRMAKIGRQISIFSGLTVYSGNSFGVVVQKWYNLESFYIQQPDPRLTLNLFWVAYLPIDTSKNINFAVSLLLQFYTSFIGSLAYFVFDSLIAMTTLHVCGQLDCLKLSFAQLCENENTEKPWKFQKDLRRIVQRHSELIRSVAENHFSLDNSFNFVLFLSFIGCTLTFCFQGYAIIRVILLDTGKLNFFQVAFSATVTMGAISHFFICCWMGDLLITQSTAVGQAYYKNVWYKLPHQQARSLMIIGFKNFRSLQLTAGKFVPLSLNLFLKVIKSSMSYLSMLLAVQSRQV
ncbi:odorant receptor Or2-like [Diachasma alloeum]|uniref:Odorant receptor n=1 Tax=Diachasma alloeum TaxID=454923 RepID=A0A4E0RPA3_9HYME|nr:odorant receptor Or2-like [Diachasma alloeum]THK33246.1 odorant receptor 24 [Diachasma alloeum]